MPPSGSNEAANTYLPSTENSTALTGLAQSMRVTGLPLEVSHIRAVLSPLPVAT
jgi:hypothetical protein